MIVATADQPELQTVQLAQGKNTETTHHSVQRSYSAKRWLQTILMSIAWQEHTSACIVAAITLKNATISIPSIC